MLTNRRLRKSPTPSIVDGPPMFMKTMAVGPFEPTFGRDRSEWIEAGRTWLREKYRALSEFDRRQKLLGQRRLQAAFEMIEEGSAHGKDDEPIRF